MQMNNLVYLDYHATTPVDPRVLEAMLPYFSNRFGNPASLHGYGAAAKEAVEEARASIAHAIGVDPREIIFTSGATESNNLAIFGVTQSPRCRGKHVVSVATEHRAVLDPLKRLAQKGFEITLLPVRPWNEAEAGLLDLEQFAAALRTDTCLVSVMLANNEIGVIQPIAEIGRLCSERGIPFHCDATQAVGKLPIRLKELNVDLMSFSAHKLYGPKGIGGLYVRQSNRQLRLEPLIWGGGHENGLRSGTLNVPAIVGFARAIEICLAELPHEAERLRRLRDLFFRKLWQEIGDVHLNGPALDRTELRLANNLNVSFPYLEAESLLLSAPDLAASPGSACSSSTPGPSHVLQALGLPEHLLRGGIRFGLGRFTTEDDIDKAVGILWEAVRRLRAFAGLGMRK